MGRAVNNRDSTVCSVRGIDLILENVDGNSRRYVPDRYERFHVGSPINLGDDVVGREGREAGTETNVDLVGHRVDGYRLCEIGAAVQHRSKDLRGGICGPVQDHDTLFQPDVDLIRDRVDCQETRSHHGCSVSEVHQKLDRSCYLISGAVDHGQATNVRISGIDRVGHGINGD